VQLGLKVQLGLTVLQVQPDLKGQQVLKVLTVLLE
jgi:hypothetical protein